MYIVHVCVHVVHVQVYIVYIIVAALHGRCNYFAGSTLISILKGCNLLTNHTVTHTDLAVS